jgi:hypothetical protein
VTNPNLEPPASLDRRNKKTCPDGVPGEPHQKASSDQTEDAPAPSPDSQEQHSPAAANDGSLPAESTLPQVHDILIADIEIGTRHRKDMGDLKELARSIDKHGLSPRTIY